MIWLLLLLLFLLLAGAAIFGYPLFCMLRRFWGWGRLWGYWRFWSGPS